MIGKWNLTNLQEDVKLLKDMNMDTFRFSIAWTRILPSEYILNWCTNDEPRTHTSSIWITKFLRFELCVTRGDNWYPLGARLQGHLMDTNWHPLCVTTCFCFCIAAAAGSLSGGINKEGVAFYNNLINEVIANGSRSINLMSLPFMQLIL